MPTLIKPMESANQWGQAASALTLGGTTCFGSGAFYAALNGNSRAYTALNIFLTACCGLAYRKLQQNPANALSIPFKVIFGIGGFDLAVPFLSNTLRYAYLITAQSLFGRIY